MTQTHKGQGSPTSQQQECSWQRSAAQPGFLETEPPSQEGPHAACSGTASCEAVNMWMCVSQSQTGVEHGLPNGWDMG